MEVDVELLDRGGQAVEKVEEIVLAEQVQEVVQEGVEVEVELLDRE